MKNNTRVVFCEDQGAVNRAVQKWVNENGYKRVYTSEANLDAAHFHEQSAGQYSRSPKTPIDKYKFAVIFEGG